MTRYASFLQGAVLRPDMQPPQSNPDSRRWSHQIDREPAAVVGHKMTQALDTTFISMALNIKVGAIHHLSSNALRT